MDAIWAIVGLGLIAAAYYTGYILGGNAAEREYFASLKKISDNYEESVARIRKAAGV